MYLLLYSKYKLYLYYILLYRYVKYYFKLFIFHCLPRAYRWLMAKRSQDLSRAEKALLTHNTQSETLLADYFTQKAVLICRGFRRAKVKAQIFKKLLLHYLSHSSVC